MWKVLNDKPFFLMDDKYGTPHLTRQGVPLCKCSGDLTDHKSNHIYCTFCTRLLKNIQRGQYELILNLSKAGWIKPSQDYERYIFRVDNLHFVLEFRNKEIFLQCHEFIPNSWKISIGEYVDHYYDGVRTISYIDNPNNFSMYFKGDERFFNCRRLLEKEFHYQHNDWLPHFVVVSDTLRATIIHENRAYERTIRNLERASEDKYYVFTGEAIINKNVFTVFGNSPESCWRTIS